MTGTSVQHRGTGMSQRQSTNGPPLLTFLTSSTISLRSQLTHYSLANCSSNIRFGGFQSDRRDGGNNIEEESGRGEVGRG